MSIQTNARATKHYEVTFNPASVAATTLAHQTVTVTGVAVGDIVRSATPRGGFLVSAAANADLSVISAFVTAADTVRVAIYNSNASGRDADSQTWDFEVEHRTAH